ncbi:hypothetical protein N665_0502s0023 [Sinapis alba]|nr:hypothetical protein N665_0502s0023 [Sinapis alba]
MCFDSITHTAEAEYATAKTSVWWDIENCPAPKGCDAHSIAQKLNSSLVNLNYCGPLSISAYGNTDLIPKAVQQALSSTGISLNHVPSGKKDASDKKILVDMFLWVLENPAPANLMLISGDGDFFDALHRLRMRRYNILLAHPLQASSPSLVASARTSWMWRSLLSSGCPLSAQSCSFGSEMSSRDVSVSVSEHVCSTQESGSSKAARKKLKGINVMKEVNQQKKCSETEWLCRVCNVDCKNIEEIVQDSDLQTRDAQESMKCLEKQNKELMESIATSERSGREFWQDFKERLDKNGVAPPLDVDHVFSELSRDFHVPKEVRECFEAIFKKLEPTQNDIEIEKLESMLKQGLEIESGEPENAPAEPTETLIEDMTKKKKSTGRKHAAKFKKHIEALLDNHQKPEELRIKPVEAPENIDYLDKQRQEELEERCVTSERSVEDFFQTIEEVQENDYKSLPNAECIFTELNPEFSASREAREWTDAIFKKPEVSEDANLSRELESIPSQNLEMNSGDPESSSAEATEHPEEYTDMKKENGTKDNDVPKPYVCSICSVSCVSPIVFESHLMGRKHATRVLFDDKKVLEQSLEEKDHPRDALEELQLEPKDAQVSIKEVSLCLSSRERFDSMVERLELFMEKTSKQTLVEAENASERVGEVTGTGKENGVAAAQIRVCDWCSVICNNQMDFDSHLAGKGHADTLRKHVPLVKKEVVVM